jgi:hypothetical protein
MAIATTDVLLFLTGAASDGAAQADPDASTGGYRASNQVAAGDNNLLDDVSGAEASAGDVEYRCYCYKNNHGSLSLQAPKIYISSTTGVSDDNLAYAVEVPTGGDTNGTCQTIADESTAPTVNAGNVSDWDTGTTPATGQGVDQGGHDANLDNGEIVFVWVRRTVGAGAVAVTAESATMAISGDTAA